MVDETPEGHIAAAIWPQDSPDFRDVCNTIRPYVELELDKARLCAYRYLMTKDADDRKSILLLRDLVLEAQKSVDEKTARVRLIEASRQKLRPIR